MPPTLPPACLPRLPSPLVRLQLRPRPLATVLWLRRRSLGNRLRLCHLGTNCFPFALRSPLRQPLVKAIVVQQEPRRHPVGRFDDGLPVVLEYRECSPHRRAIFEEAAIEEKGEFENDGCLCHVEAFGQVTHCQGTPAGEIEHREQAQKEAGHRHRHPADVRQKLECLKVQHASIVKEGER